MLFYEAWVTNTSSEVRLGGPYFLQKTKGYM